jgi:hypothetical protein
MKKWGQLTKHEKEKRVMFALMGAIAIAASVIYGILPFLDRLDRRVQALDKIEANFARLERMAASEERNARALAKGADDLRRAMKDHLPPVEGPFLWATEQIYSRARVAGIEIQSLTERRAGIPSWVRDPSKAPPPVERAEGEGAPPAMPQPSRRFAPYAVQLGARGSYSQLVAYLAALERSSPYLRVSSLYLAASSIEGGGLDVSMTIEWPWHIGPAPDLAAAAPATEAQP